MSKRINKSGGKSKHSSIEIEYDESEKKTAPDRMELVERKKMKMNREKKDDNQNHEQPPTAIEMPSNWRIIHANIVKMRSETLAAVDTMGCDQCYDKNISDKQRRFQILVALMLSSQTRDQTTHATMNELRKHNLSVDFIQNISCEELMKLIKSVGFYRRKAEYIKKTAQILKNEYNGDIPATLNEMMKLPGVGPKMAHLAMKCAWNKMTGIGVDTHVHRISNRLGWVRQTKTPEQTRIQLEQWLPPEMWWEINHLLVGFGQTICLPQRPRCKDCLNNQICPSSTESLQF